jgi:hypothetical protein
MLNTLSGRVYSVRNTDNAWCWEFNLLDFATVIASNKNGDCKIIQMLLNCCACYPQSSWPKESTTVFIMLLYIHDISSLAYDP